MSRSWGRSHSIIRRLMIGLTLAVGVVSIVAVVTFGVLEMHKGRMELETVADTSIDFVSKMLERPMWDYDTERASLVANVLFDDPRVIQVIIREASGRQIYGVTRGDTTNAIARSSKIIHKDRELGNVSVAFTTDNYTQRAWSTVKTTALVCVIVILTVFATTGLLIRAYLRRPLDNIAKIVNSYSAGDYTPFVDKIPYSEFRPITAVLAQMGERIQAQFEQLQGLNQELRVHATELSKANSRLEAEVVERTRAELELQRSQAMVEQVLDSVPLSVFWKDRNGVYLGCNADFMRSVGLKDINEIIGKTDYDLPWPRDEAAAYRAIDREVIESNRRRMNIAEPLQRADGKRVWVSTSKVPLTDKQGRVYGVLGVCDDITERKHNQEALQQERDFSNIIINNLPGIFCMIDVVGRHIRWNANHQRTSGYRAEEYATLNMMDIVVEQDQAIVREKMKHVFEVGPVSVEVRGRTKNGTTIPFLLTGAKVVLDGRPYLVGIGLDMSERKQAEAELEKYKNHLEELVQERTEALEREISERKRVEEALLQAKDSAEAANRAKSTFLASMSHEIRTPLNAILGYSHLLKRDEKLSQKHHQSIAAISRSGEHLMDLLSDILAMSKIEAGRSTLDEGVFDLHDLLRALESMFALRVHEKGLRLALEMGKQLPRYVNTDQRKLRQVLFNLLSNAVRFTASGSITLRAHVRPAEKAKPGEVLLDVQVEDTGSGIAPEEQSGLFEPFAQTESGRRRQGGAGLGLAISRGFVELMGGQIGLLSELGKGSCFHFTIRARSADCSPLLTTSDAILRLRPNGAPPRVLIVDDHAESRRMLCELLDSAGFSVREAVNGDEAARVWDSWRPQFIWMDMNMPVVDGYQATRTIREKDTRNETVVVALTASVFEEDRQRILASGCAACLAKPFREDAIFKCMEKFLGVEYEQRNRDVAVSAFGTLDDVATRFIEVPDNLRSLIHKATVTLDANALLAIIPDLRGDHPLVAEFLSRVAEQLDFDALHQVLLRVHDARPQAASNSK